MTGRDTRALAYIAAALVATAAFVAIEAALIVPGYLIEAQIADALLMFALVNAGPRRETRVSTARAAAALAALRGLALVPLIRVVALGLPMRDWSEPVTVLAIALPVGLVALRLAPVTLTGPRGLLSLRPVLPHLYAVVAGAGLGLVAYLAGAPALWPDGAADERIAVGVAAAILAAAVEELVFRGLIQGTLQRAAGRLGMLIAGALFAATYLDAGSTALVLTIALAGVVFGHAVARTGALGGAIIGHVLLVVGAGAVWPRLVDDSALPDPETTIALSAAIAIAVVIACWRPPRYGQPQPQVHGPAATAPQPAEDPRPAEEPQAPIIPAAVPVAAPAAVPAPRRRKTPKATARVETPASPSKSRRSRFRRRS